MTALPMMATAGLKMVQNQLGMRSVAELGLGTVQFGMDYGISNTSGRTPEPEVLDILKTARAAGVRTLDTAAAYGESETVLGKTLASMGGDSFHIVTKTILLGKARIGAEDAEQVEQGFFASLKRLRRSTVEALLVHDPNDLLAPGGHALYETLERLKAAGYTRKLGVSVDHPAQLEAILDRYPIDLAQVPLNILDQRFINGDLLTALKSNGIEVHARSVYLQGLLLMPAGAIPRALAPVRNTLTRLAAFLEDIGLSISQGALCFARQQPAVDTVLLGVNTTAQFREVAADFASVAGRRVDVSAFAVHDENLITPAKWIR